VLCFPVVCFLYAATTPFRVPPFLYPRRIPHYLQTTFFTQHLKSVAVFAYPCFSPPRSPEPAFLPSSSSPSIAADGKTLPVENQTSYLSGIAFATRDLNSLPPPSDSSLSRRRSLILKVGEGVSKLFPILPVSGC